MEARLQHQSFGRELLRGAAFLLTGTVVAANTALHPVQVATVLVGAMLALLIFSRPMLGVWLIVLLTPIEAAGPIASTESKAVKLALTALVSVALLLRKTLRADTAPDPYRWPFALILTSGFVSSLLARSPMKSLLGLLSIAVFVLYYASLRCSQALAGKAIALMQIVIWSAVLLSGLCFAQLTGGYAGFLGAAEHQSLEAEEAFSTVWPGISRACATFNGPNAAGAFFAIAGLSALVRVVVCKKLRLAYAAAALICFINLLTTFSRGAILGYFCGLLFACWHAGALPRKRLAIAFSLAAVAGALAVNENAQKYLRIGFDVASVSPERMDAWHASRILLRQNRVFGIGFYEFHDASRGIAGVADMPLHPHNGFLKALVEQGPLGACGYLLFLLTFIGKPKESSCTCNSPEQRWVLGAMAGAGICLFVQELFDANFTIGGSSIAILFACILAIRSKPRSPVGGV